MAVIQRNLAALDEGERITVQRADACRLGAAPHRFDIAFLDPPYGSGLAAPTLLALLERHGIRALDLGATRDRLRSEAGRQALIERIAGKYHCMS